MITTENGRWRWNEMVMSWLCFVWQCLVQLILLFFPIVHPLALPSFYARLSGVLEYQI